MPAKTVAQKMYLKPGMNIGFFNAPDNLWITYYKGSSSVDTDINRDSIHAFGTTINLKGVG